MNTNLIHRRLGFTLIELLIVIAIIAILAAILFPVFARARENARRTSCASNMKQMGLAFMQYYQDYDEMGPFSWLPVAGVPNDGYSWDKSILPYIGMKTGNWQDRGSFFACPSNAVADTGRSYAVPRPNNNDLGPTQAVDIPGHGTERQYRNLADFPSVATTLMLVEKPGTNIGDRWGTDAWCPGENGVATNGAQVKPLWSPTALGQPSHLEGWNYLYMDGHVKWLRPEKSIGTGYKAATVVNGKNIGVGQGADWQGNGYNCTSSFPCGPWTRDEND